MKERSKRITRTVGILALLGLAAAVAALIWRIRSQQSALALACVGVYYAFLLHYAFKGYQKPHGNTVQILMLILAVYVAASTVIADNRWGLLSWATVLASNLAAVFMGFMAGRLNKVQENRYTAILVSVLLLIRCMWFLENMNMTGGEVLPWILDRALALLMWITVAALYFFRYEEHRQAGKRQ